MANIKQIVQKMQDELAQTRGLNESLRVLVRTQAEQIRQYADDAETLRKLADEWEKMNDEIVDAIEEEPEDDGEFQPSGNEPGSGAGNKKSGKK